MIAHLKTLSILILIVLIFIFIPYYYGKLALNYPIYNFIGLERKEYPYIIGIIHLSLISILLLILISIYKMIYDTIN